MKKLSIAIIAVAAVFILSIIASCDDDDDALGERGETELMIVHGSPDTPDLQVFVDNAELTSGLGFREATEYNTVESGMHSVKLSAAGSPTNVLFDGSIQFDAGYATVFVTNLVDSLNLLTSYDNLDFPDDVELEIRIVNLSPNAGPVDFVFETSADDSLSFTNVGYNEVTEFEPISSSIQDVVSVLQSGSDSILVSVTTGSNQLLDGRMYTAILTGLANGGPSEELALTIVENR